MKFCDVTQFYAPFSGGVKRYLHEKINYLQNNSQNDEHILIVPGVRTEVIRRDRSRVYSIRSPLVPRLSGYRALLNLRSLADIIGHENPDIVESSDPYQVGWKAASLGKSLRIPVVAFYHSHFSEAYLRGPARVLRPAAERYVSALYNRFEVTLVPSEPLARTLEGWGVRNVRLVKLGVNTNTFSPQPDDRAETRNSLGLSQGKLLLIYVGRLSPEKNTRTLFAAWETLTKRRPSEFELLVIGSGPELEKLHQLQQRTGNVKWLRYCEDPLELARFYRAADLFVHPGTQETFGLASLESQACATPVVGIRGSRMDQIILHEQSSWAAKNTPEALARAVEEFSRKDLRTIGRVAAEAVALHYSWSRVFDGLFCIYRDVCTKYGKS